MEADFIVIGEFSEVEGPISRIVISPSHVIPTNTPISDFFEEEITTTASPSEDYDNCSTADDTQGKRDSHHHKLFFHDWLRSTLPPASSLTPSLLLSTYPPTFDVEAFILRVMSVELPNANYADWSHVIEVPLPPLDTKMQGYAGMGRGASYHVSQHGGDVYGDMSPTITPTLSQLQHGVLYYAYVLHITLMDLNARGYVRPMAIAYLTLNKAKLTTHLPMYISALNSVSKTLHAHNMELFRMDVSQRLADLQYTKEHLADVRAHTPHTTQASRNLNMSHGGDDLTPPPTKTCTSTSALGNLPVVSVSLSGNSDGDGSGDGSGDRGRSKGTDGVVANTSVSLPVDIFVEVPSHGSGSRDDRGDSDDDKDKDTIGFEDKDGNGNDIGIDNDHVDSGRSESISTGHITQHIQLTQQIQQIQQTQQTKQTQPTTIRHSVSPNHTQRQTISASPNDRLLTETILDIKFLHNQLQSSLSPLPNGGGDDDGIHYSSMVRMDGDRENVDETVKVNADSTNLGQSSPPHPHTRQSPTNTHTPNYTHYTPKLVESFLPTRSFSTPLRSLSTLCRTSTWCEQLHALQVALQTLSHTTSHLMELRGLSMALEIGTGGLVVREGERDNNNNINCNNSNSNIINNNIDSFLSHGKSASVLCFGKFPLLNFNMMDSPWIDDVGNFFSPFYGNRSGETFSSPLSSYSSNVHHPTSRTPRDSTTTDQTNAIQPSHPLTPPAFYSLAYFKSPYSSYLLHLVLSKTYSFLPHAIFTILSSRPLVILADPSHRNEVTMLVRALSYFIPSCGLPQHQHQHHQQDGVLNACHNTYLASTSSPPHETEEVVEWYEGNVGIRLLSRCKIVAISRPFFPSSSSFPKQRQHGRSGSGSGNSAKSPLSLALQRYVSVWDYDKQTLLAPEYKGTLVCSLLSGLFTDVVSFMYHIHAHLYEWASLASLWYHQYCVNPHLAQIKKWHLEYVQNGISIPVSERDDESYHSDASNAFFQHHNISKSDEIIIKSLVRVVAISLTKFYHERQYWVSVHCKSSDIKNKKRPNPGPIPTPVKLVNMNQILFKNQLGK